MIRKELILPEYIGNTYLVETGKKEKKEVLIKLEHLGLKFGNLVMTKVVPLFKRKSKSKLKKKTKK